MYLKRRTGNKPLWIGLAAVLIVVFITYKQEQGLIQANFEQKIQTLDLGYSAYPGIRQILRDLPKIVSYKITGFPDRPPIERIDIDIPLMEYKKILGDRERALLSKMLSDPSDVKAKVRHRGKTFKAKLRLKGDLSDHWLSQYRMSFRLSLKGGNTVLGFNKFSLQKPESRQHPYDQAFSDLVRRSGNLASVHHYIRVFVNGTDWGVMNIEEHMSKEYLEKQNRKESLIVKFGDERKGVMNTNIDENEQYSPYRLSDPRLYLKIYDADEYLSESINRKRISYIMEGRLKKEHSYLYDATSYGRALAIAAIWNDAHPLISSNSRHYFNPYTLKLEPIINDAHYSYSIYTRGFLPRKKLDPYVNSFWYSQVLRSDEYRRSIETILIDVINASTNTQRALDNYQKYFPLDDPVNIAPFLQANAEIVTQLKDQYLLPYDINIGLRLNQNIIEGHLPTSTNNHIQAFHRENGNISIYNLLYAPVGLKEFLIDGKIFTLTNFVIPAAIPNYHEPAIFETELKGDMSGRLELRTSYRGEERITAAEPTMDIVSYRIPKQPHPQGIHSLPSKSQARYFSEHIHVRHFTDGRIKIFNLLDDDVTLHRILFDGHQILSKPRVIKGYTHRKYAAVTISTHLKGILDGRITVESEYKNNMRSLSVGPTLDDSDLYNPLIVSDINNLPNFIRKSDSNDWAIPPGEWVVNSPLIINGNLRIEAGATIRFEPDAYLIVKGALIANGTSDERIIMDSTRDKWKGIYVVNAKKLSRLSHVEIRNTIALEDGILALSGGTTFYKSEIAMEDVVFVDSTAEDALNIVESDFYLDRITINNAISDGIDFDFSSGKIFSSHFTNIGGDALDFSGSDIEGNGIDIRNVRDKAISVGEATNISLENIDINDVGVGIVSKDGSTIRGEGINIVNYHLGGIMSYMKKNFYSYPRITLNDVRVSDFGNAYSRQQGSYMRINGTDIPAKLIDVDSLYNTEIMRK